MNEQWKGGKYFMGLSETLKAISAPIRRQILDSLKSGPKSAGEIVEQFN